MGWLGGPDLAADDVSDGSVVSVELFALAGHSPKVLLQHYAKWLPDGGAGVGHDVVGNAAGASGG